jgi:hypothetical protein
MADSRTVRITDHITARIDWINDPDGDTSWLGDFVSRRPDEYFIDRKHGVFLGEQVEIPYIEVHVSELKPFVKQPGRYVLQKSGYVRTPDEMSGSFEYDDGYATPDGYGAAQRAIVAKIEEMGYWWEDYDDGTVVQHDPERRVFYVDSTWAWKLLAKDLGHTWGGDRYMRYWVPSENHIPHNPRNWAHVKEEDRAECIAKYGSLEKTDIHYAIEDWKRLEDYGCGWSFMGCKVTVFVDGIKVGESSVCGIDSDCDSKYREEVERDEIISALGLAVQMNGRLKQAAAVLEALDLKSLKLEELDLETVN